ncbi:ankyrin repeat domain-containing protein [Halobacillus litoralis]|uniref:ankyrin repeat domain-containing protein n=1 Tax=Halobacillus litoralis TaxID=45668 RepID=UPI0013705BEB|nr:ankyrin repeat domain-containing protein [Halobacillus litoralis]
MNIKKAIQKENISECIQYLEDNVDEFLASDLKSDPLYLSLDLRSSSITQWLLKDNYHIKCDYDKQLSLLKKAAFMGNHIVVMELLKTNSFSQNDLTEVLYQASATCDVLIVIILLESGAIFNENNLSPLIQAIDMDNREVAALLLDKIADIHKIDSEGFSLLHHVAAISRDKELLQYLIYRGADVNQRNSYRETPLMLCLFSLELEHENDFLACTEVLLNAGADVNLQDNDGNSVLMTAFKYKDYIIDGNEVIIDYMKMLVKHGANVNLRNENGQTAMDLAQQYYFEEAVEFLKKYANPLVVPSIHTTERNSAQSSENDYPKTSFLSERGYSTKISRKKRWEILQAEILNEYPTQQVINKLSEFIRRFKSQRNGATKYSEAIAEWEYDIDRINRYHHSSY